MNPKQITFKFGFGGSQPVFQQKGVRILLWKKNTTCVLGSLDLCRNEAMVFHKNVGEAPPMLQKKPRVEVKQYEN